MSRKKANIWYDRTCKNVRKSAIYEITDPFLVTEKPSDKTGLSGAFHVVFPNTKYFYVEAVSFKSRVVKVCPLNSKHNIKEPTEITVEVFGTSKSKLGHFLSGEFIVVDQLLQLLVREKITGFRPISVNVLRWNVPGSVPDTKLWWLKTTGSAGKRWRLKSKNSASIWPDTCPACSQSLVCPACNNKQFYKCDSCGVEVVDFSKEDFKVLDEPPIVDERNWDKSDFFTFDGGGGVFITRRVLDLFLSEGIENFAYREIDLCLDA